MKEDSEVEAEKQQQLVAFDPETISSDENKTDVDLQLPKIFSSRRPRDAAAGLNSGLKNIGKGIALGAASLVCAPIAGAATKGVSGFAKGLVAGVVGAVALPVAGVATGVSQLAKGIWSTPKAVKEKLDGEKEWNKEKGCWVKYELDVEIAEVLKMTDREFLTHWKEKKNGTKKDADSSTEQSPPISVKEKDFYDVLRVPVTATPKEIRKAYYRLAKRLHPDIGLEPSDKKFVALGRAYQVLSDPTLRSKYDRHGQEGIENAELMDTEALFFILFGSAGFEKYVGELRLVSVVSEARAGTDDLEKIQPFGSAEETLLARFHQLQREVRCAENIRNRIHTFVDAWNPNGKTFPPLGATVQLVGLSTVKFNGLRGVVLDYPPPPIDVAQRAFVRVNVNGECKSFSIENIAAVSSFKTLVDPLVHAAFLREARQEAKELTSTPIGGSLIGIIGYNFIAQAKQYLGGVSGMISSMRQKTRKIGHKGRFLSGGLKMFNAARKEKLFWNKQKVEVKEQNEQLKKATQQFFKNNSSLLVSTVWDACVLDIEATLKNACRKLFNDKGVSRKKRIHRARALLQLGTIFYDAGINRDDGLRVLQEKFLERLPQPTTVLEDPADDVLHSFQQLTEEQLRLILIEEGVDVKNVIGKDELIRMLKINLRE